MLFRRRRSLRALELIISRDINLLQTLSDAHKREVFQRTKKRETNSSP